MNKALLVLLFVGTITTLPVAADKLEDAAECAAVTDSLQRLTCFDRIFPKRATEDADAESLATLSAWDISRERSPIDDSPTIYAALHPTDSSGTGLGQHGISILARCQENTTAFLIHTDMFMTDNPRVTIRIGTAPAETSTWSRSSNYQAAGLWRGSQAIPFLRKLKNGERMAIRVESRERQDGIFNLGNVEDVVAEIADACGWTP